MAPASPRRRSRSRSHHGSRETLDCAEKILGVDFSEQEEQAALNGVNNNLQNYERLRALDIPLDTEPAVTFRPYLPGKKPKPGATPGAKIVLKRIRRATHQSKTQDLPVTALAPLVQRRDVSSTELTRMYLERLEKHGVRLNAVVTVTEELALAQAAQADKEIKSGKYRGPLHGIPWGAKDLFATKGIAPSVRRLTRTRSSITTPRSSSDYEMPVPCSSPSCLHGRPRKATAGSAGRRRTLVLTIRSAEARAVRRALARRRRRAGRLRHRH